MPTLRRNVIFSLTAVGLVFSLTSCTPQSDPVLEKVLRGNLGELKLANEVKGHCQPMVLFCSQPLFEPAFTASDDKSAEQICDSVVSLQNQIGLVAFSRYGEPATKVSDLAAVKEFCVSSISIKEKAFDESKFYPGIALFDDGAKDGMGKVTTISREVNRGYFVVFSLSRDLDRIGSIDYGADK